MSEATEVVNSWAKTCTLASARPAVPAQSLGGVCPAPLSGPGPQARPVAASSALLPCLPPGCLCSHFMPSVTKQAPLRTGCPGPSTSLAFRTQAAKPRVSSGRGLLRCWLGVTRPQRENALLMPCPAPPLPGTRKQPKLPRMAATHCSPMRGPLGAEPAPTASGGALVPFTLTSCHPCLRAGGPLWISLSSPKSRKLQKTPCFVLHP